MSLERCPSCNWPVGPGCEICNQAAVDFDDAAINEQVAKLHAAGEELRRGFKNRATIWSLIYHRAAALWGHRAQMRMLQEEAAEVIVAVNHALRPGCPDGTYPPDEANKLAEEMADLEIMLEQMRATGWAHLIDHHKEIKLERLKGRVERAEENNR